MATAAAGGTFAPPLEEVAAGQEVTLRGGDAVSVPARVAGEVRIDDAEPAVALAFIVAPAAEGTPVAATG